MRTPKALLALTPMLGLLLFAPAASAQSEPFNGTYTEKFVGPGPTGKPACQDDAFACGSGTAAGLGAFTGVQTFDETCLCALRTLTFSDGSKLVLDQSLVSITGPGGSGSSNAPATSEGHPGSAVFSWTVDPRSSGSFSGATGTGTESAVAAGLVATGTLSGTITFSP